ncbi:MAG: PAS domain S-box protein [Verrucomicrobiales bacterium]|nr:PAS domain S-box protein [Verrucomicrobiales bacterium]
MNVSPTSPVRQSGVRRPAWLWTRLVIVLLAATGLAVALVQFRRAETNRRARQVFSAVREGRIDLSQGLLHMFELVDPDASSSAEVGFNRMEQAVIALEGAESEIRSGDLISPGTEWLADFRAELGRLREVLAARRGAPGSAGQNQAWARSAQGSAQSLDGFSRRLETLVEGELRAQAAGRERWFLIMIGALSGGVGVLGLGLYRAEMKQRELLQVEGRRERTEKALRESNARLQKVLEVETVGVIFWEMPSGVMIDANDTFLNLMGYSRREVEARELTWQKLTLPEFMEVSLAEIRKFETTGRVGPYEKQYLRKDGTRRWLLFAGSALDTGTIVEFCVDIAARKEAEAALRESEANLQNFLNTAATGLVRNSRDLRYVSVNTAYAKLVGKPADQIVGHTLSEVLGESALESIRAHVEKVLRGDRVEFETEMAFASGERRWIHVIYTPDRSASGEIVGWVGSITDISQRRNAEARLRNEEATLRGILDATTESVFLFDRKGTILTANATAARRYGKALDDVVGCNFLELMTTEVGQSRQAWFEEILHSDRPVEFEDARAGIQFHHSLYPIRDAMGNVDAVVCYSRDITARKEAELALHAEYERLTSVVLAQREIAGVNLGYSALLQRILERMTRLSGADGASLEMAEGDDMVYHAATGLAAPYVGLRVRIAGSLSGLCMTSDTVLRSDDTEADTRVDREACRRIGLRSMCLLPLRYGGSSFGVLKVMSSRVSAFSKSVERTLRLMGEFLSATVNRKRLEEERAVMEAQLRQQQKLEAIGTLASGVAHEINNPITGIWNYAQLIQDRLPQGSPLAEFTGEIMHETQRVATIVRNLLTFSRDEKQSHSPARIVDVVQAVVSLVRTVIRSDQITLVLRMAEDLPQLKCRSQQIQQVIMNLMTNARDALNDRYPGYHEDKVLKLETGLVEKAGRRWIRITVEDHGVGIPPEVRDRIFDPFFTTKGRDRGTGLGLSISHGIVREHHGEWTVESEPGRYTRMHVDLPVDNGWAT